MALIRTRVSLVLLVALAAAPAHAQDAGLDEEARALYEAGLSAYNNGRFESALRHFNHGYEASERAAFLYNVGLTHERLFHLPEALAAYRGFLEGVPEAPNRALVEARILQIQRQLEASGNAETDTPSETETPGGTDAADPLEEPATSADGAQPIAEDSATPSPDGGSGLMVAGFAVAGGGAALLLVGAITGGLAISEHDSLSSTCAPSCTADQTAGGETLAVVTDVLLVGGGLVAATGLVIAIVALTSGGGDDDRAGGGVRISPLVGPAVAGGFVEGWF